MSLRFAMPMVERRGAGLGNELILWGKAFIAGQALGMTWLHPAWGLNPRRYHRYFNTSRADWIIHRAMRAALPLVTFDEDDYLSIGGGDFHDAIAAFGEARGLRDKTPIVLGLKGLWGGPGLLTGAREFLRAQLLATRGTLGNLYEISRRMGEGRIHVGMHIRRGDFGVPAKGAFYAGRFNVPIPLDWYMSIARTLVAAFGEQLSLLIVSDAAPEELAPITRQVRCVETIDLHYRDVSDMMALAACDFVVCSVSSYSMWAAFFCQGRYAWFMPQLTERGGLGSIWGHRATQAHPDAAIPRAERAVAAWQARGETIAARGVPVGLSGALPAELLIDIEDRFRRRRRASDLIGYGVVPLSAS